MKTALWSTRASLSMSLSWTDRGSDTVNFQIRVSHRITDGYVGLPIWVTDDKTWDEVLARASARPGLL